MNENWYKQYLMETGRRKEEIKQAEAYRLWKNGSEDNPHPLKKQRGLLTILGAMLGRWRDSAQAHYDNLSEERMTGIE